jgi:hypothetical protein
LASYFGQRGEFCEFGELFSVDQEETGQPSHEGLRAYPPGKFTACLKLTTCRVPSPSTTTRLVSSPVEVLHCDLDGVILRIVVDKRHPFCLNLSSQVERSNLDLRFLSKRSKKDGHSIFASFRTFHPPSLSLDTAP